MQYVCPKCHCGVLFEDHNKLVCIDCGYETNKLRAAGARHEHSYQTYSGQRPNVGGTSRAAEVPKTAFQSLPISGQKPYTSPSQKPQVNRNSVSSGYSVSRSQAASGTSERPKTPARKPLGFSMLFFIIFALFFITIILSIFE